MSSEEPSTLRKRRGSRGSVPTASSDVVRATPVLESRSSASLAAVPVPARAAVKPAAAAHPGYSPLPSLFSSLPSLRVFVPLVLLALLLRVLLLSSPWGPALRARVELAGPTTSALRLQEGLVLSRAALPSGAAAASPYAGGVLRHSPLFFYLFHGPFSATTILARALGDSALRGAASVGGVSAAASTVTSMPRVPFTAEAGAAAGAEALWGLRAAAPLLPYVLAIFTAELLLALALAGAVGYYASRPVPVPRSVQAFAACAQDWRQHHTTQQEQEQEQQQRHEQQPEGLAPAAADAAAAVDAAVDADAGADSAVPLPPAPAHALKREPEVSLSTPPPWLPSAVAAAVLLNPFSVLSCAALSTAAVPHAALALATLAAARFAPAAAASLLALAVHLDPALAVTVPAVAALVHSLARDSRTRRAPANADADATAAAATARARTATLVFCGMFAAAFVVLFLLSCLAGMTVEGAAAAPAAAAAAAAASGSPLSLLWSLLLPRLSWMDASWGCQLTLCDRTPSVGLLWYFALQVFPRFRAFFAAVFAAHTAVYVAALLVRLPRWPLFTAWAAAAVALLFKPHPTAADAAFILCALLPHLPLVSHRARRPHLLLFLLAQVALTGAAMWTLWTERAAGNANFFFFQTVLFSFTLALFVVEQVSAVRRLQSIPPGALAIVNAA